MPFSRQVTGEYFGFSIEGLKELNDALEELPKSLRKTPLRNTLKKATKPVYDRALDEIPVESGYLKEHMVVSPRLKASQRRKTRRFKDEVEVFVGNNAPHAHLIEFGTKERFRKSGGSTGQMTPNPFMTRAWDASKHDCLQIIIKELRTEIAKAAERLRRRRAKGTSRQ